MTEARVDTADLRAWAALLRCVAGRLGDGWPRTHWEREDITWVAGELERAADAAGECRVTESVITESEVR